MVGLLHEFLRDVIGNGAEAQCAERQRMAFRDDPLRLERGEERDLPGLEEGLEPFGNAVTQRGEADQGKGLFRL